MVFLFQGVREKAVEDLNAHANFKLEERRKKSAEAGEQMHRILLPLMQKCALQGGKAVPIGAAEAANARKSIESYLESVDWEGKANAASAICGDDGSRGWMQRQNDFPLRGINGELEILYLDMKRLGKLPISDGEGSTLATLAANIEAVRKIMYVACNITRGAWADRVSEGLAGNDTRDDNGPSFSANDCMFALLKAFDFQLYRYALHPDYRGPLGIDDFDYDAKSSKYRKRYLTNYETGVVSKYDADLGMYRDWRRMNFVNGTIEKPKEKKRGEKSIWDFAFTSEWEVLAKDIDWEKMTGVKKGADGKWGERVPLQLRDVDCFGRPLGFAFSDRQAGGVGRQMDESEYAKLTPQEKEQAFTGNFRNSAVLYVTGWNSNAADAMKTLRQGDMVFEKHGYFNQQKCDVDAEGNKTYRVREWSGHTFKIVHGFGGLMVFNLTRKAMNTLELATLSMAFDTDGSNAQAYRDAVEEFREAGITPPDNGFKTYRFVWDYAKAGQKISVRKPQAGAPTSMLEDNMPEWERMQGSARNAMLGTPVRSSQATG